MAMSEDEYSELLALARRNNEMLSEILSYVRKVDSPGYRAGKDDRDFLMNVVANALVERMFDGRQNYKTRQ